MKKLIGLSLVLVCLSQIGQAQDAADFSGSALDFSWYQMGGTSRIQGMGGVGTALGADATNAFLNPAGLGFYNKSEFSFTPGFDFYLNESNYLDNSLTSSRVNVNIADMNILWNHTVNTKGKWHGGSFAINVNRMASFNQRYSYEGYNGNEDFIDFAVNSENGFGEYVPNDFSLLALNEGAIDYFSVPDVGQSTVSVNGIDRPVEDLDYDNSTHEFMFYDRNTYRGDELGYPTPDNPTYQYEKIRSRGGLYQTSFSYGANYGDRVYFGAGIGLLSLRREVERTYSEEPSNADLNYLELTDDYTQDGFGINGTFGVMFRPVTPVIIGLSYTTPSWMGIDQQREISLYTEYNDGESYEDGNVYDNFSYTLKTPARLRGGATVFLGKDGFISADVEHVDYSNAKLSNASSGDFIFDNGIISDYNSTVNFSIGGEYRLDIFRFRAGFSHQGDPTDDELDNTQNSVSLGAGLRTSDFFVDLSTTTGLKQNFNVSPYPFSSLAEVKSDISRLTFTVGWFF